MKFKEIFTKYKFFIIIGSIIVALIIINLYPYNEPANEEAIESEVTVKPKTTEKESLVKVDIKGQVNQPGVYELSSSSRVIDVINKAEGFTPNADSSLINLSKKIKDEMVIIVYSKDEVQKMKEDDEVTCECPSVNDACTEEELPLLIENTSDETDTDNSQNKTSQKISLNQSSLSELQTLNGIGEAKAQAIIDYRNENGPFKTIDEIKNVSGIGEALFDKIKGDITT